MSLCVAGADWLKLQIEDRQERKKTTDQSKLHEVQRSNGAVWSRNVFQALESAGTGRYIHDRNAYMSPLHFHIKLVLFSSDSLWVPARS